MLKYIHKLSRYLILLLFICLFTFGLYSHHLLYERIIKRDLLTENQNLISIFAENVWHKYNNTIEKLANTEFNKSKWKENEEYVKFAIDSLEFFKKYPAVKITIYNSKGDKLLATNKYKISSNEQKSSKISSIKDINLIFDKLSMVFAPKIPPNPLKLALSGKVNSNLLLDANYINDEGVPKRGYIFSSYIPISDDRTEDYTKQITGVIEINRDISKEWKELSYIRFITICLVILICLVGYLVILFNKLKIKKIIKLYSQENKILEEAKIKAENESKRKSEFLVNVSHELRTPLNIIIGFSDILKNEAFGPITNEKYKEYINDIHVSGTHLLGLINDILDYSKATSGHLKIECIPLEIRKVINSSIRLITPKAEEAAVEIIKVIADKNLIILADQKRLKQALMNLLANSIKFTPAGGNVTVTAHKSIDISNNEIIEIIIEDTGIGIAEKDLTKVMSSFGQVDSKLNRKYEGTGIGLPYTRTLVEMMNGKFLIESELGVGTKITLTFFAENFINNGST